MHEPTSTHAPRRGAQQLRDGDDGQPAGAASASSVEGARRGRSDVWPFPMARNWVLFSYRSFDSESRPGGVVYIDSTRDLVMGLGVFDNAVENYYGDGTMP